MTTISFIETPYEPFKTIEPGRHEATIMEVKEMYEQNSNESVLHVIWNIEGTPLTDKFRIANEDRKKRGYAQYKLKKLVAALGLPEVPQVTEGARNEYGTFLLPGKSCVVEVKHFQTNDKTYAYVDDYMALPPKKPLVQLPEKPEPMGKMFNDDIPL